MPDSILELQDHIDRAMTGLSTDGLDPPTAVAWAMTHQLDIALNGRSVGRDKSTRQAWLDLLVSVSELVDQTRDTTPRTHIPTGPHHHTPCHHQRQPNTT
jgi:hypothetical protein